MRKSGADNDRLNIYVDTGRSYTQVGNKYSGVLQIIQALGDTTNR